MSQLERLRAKLAGLFSSVQTRLSPNRSSRRGASVKGVVIHTTEGGFIGSTSWMLNPRSEVSAHYVVGELPEPRGGLWTPVVALVPEGEKAWTARSANPVTINYELAGFANRPRSEWLGRYRPQLETTAALVAEDALQYGIPVQRTWPGILGHGDLSAAGFPNNHTDPGPGFPWPEFLAMVRRNLSSVSRPDVAEQPVPRYRCLPPGLSRIPPAAWKLAEWHLSGRKGPRPASAPAHVDRAWPWYWEWFHCRFLGGRHARP